MEPLCTIDPVSNGTAGMAALAAEAEDDKAYWRREFDRLLGEEVITAVSGSRGGHSLLNGGLVTQFGLHLDWPPGPGDPRTRLRQELVLLARRIAPMMATDAEVCIDLSTVIERRRVLHESLSVDDLLEILISGIPAALAGFGVRPRKLWFSFRVSDLSTLALLKLRNVRALGRPRLLLRLPDELLLEAVQNTGAHSEFSSQWFALTALAHRDPGIFPVLESTTRSSCDLCGAERADSVLPLSCFEVAHETAWLTLQIDIKNVGPGLRRMLRVGLRLADNLIDQVDWGSYQVHEDAVENRRLAIQVSGIGDLVDRQGWNPAVFSTTRAVSRRLALLKALLVSESQSLARRRGPFPALGTDALVQVLVPRFGRKSAESLVRRHSLRHRHLLALSPFGVFPRHNPSFTPADYLHLLSGLRWADTIALYGDEHRQLLTLAEYRKLLRMTWAQARNRI
jgi:hypothetical protein